MRFSVTTAIDGADVKAEGRQDKPCGSNCKNWKSGQSALALKTEPFWKVLEGLKEKSQAINKSSGELKT